jgi:hypothetical protein
MISTPKGMPARIALALVVLLTAGGAPISVPAAPRPAPRCGWIANPTPANWWLTDRSGEWLIGVQGGYQAPGLDNVPDLTERQWVVTNGSSYGYGCACVSGTFDARRKRVARIDSIRQQPLAVCRADRRLKRPGD